MNTPAPRLFFIIGLIFNLMALLVFEGAEASPPSRVARLNYLKGDVSFSPAGQNHWFHAVRNRPLTLGDRLWTNKRGLAGLQLGGASLCLGSFTGISILNLNNQIGQFKLSEGSVVLNIPFIKPNQRYEIATPNLAFSVHRKGSYQIRVNLKNKTTTVSVLSGQAEVYGEKGRAHLIERGESYRFYGADLKRYERVEMETDNFYACHQQPHFGKKLRTARYVSPEMVGYEDLDDYGEWIILQDYGPVWRPHRVRFDWAPYRFGHWAWIHPWGWTWIDDEPWGFAPFHYGRWVFVKKSWYWVPGLKEKPPVYAPALVVFLKDKHFGASEIRSGPGIGWLPLGSNEVYVPPYEVNQDYFIHVNESNMTTVNTTYIKNVYQQKITNFNYSNSQVPNAVTAVPAAAFVEGKPVEKNKVLIPQETINKTRMTPTPSVNPIQESTTASAKPTHSQPTEKVLEQTVVAKTPLPERSPEPTTSPLAPDTSGRSGSEAIKPLQPTPPSENIKVISPIETLEPVHLPEQERPATEPLIQTPNEAKPEEKLKPSVPQSESVHGATQLNPTEEMQKLKPVEPTTEAHEKPIEKPEVLAPKLEFSEPPSSEQDKSPIEPETQAHPQENMPEELKSSAHDQKAPLPEEIKSDVPSESPSTFPSQSTIETPSPTEPPSVSVAPEPNPAPKAEVPVPAEPVPAEVRPETVPDKPVPSAEVIPAKENG